MKQSGQTLRPDNLQAVLDSAGNTARVGTQQYLTPLDLAAALSIPLPAKARPSIADFTCGNGHLLAASGATECLGVDIDPAAIRARVPGSPEQRWNVSVADITLLYGLLAESDTRFDLMALNPPFSLTWDTARLAALADSHCEAVRTAFPKRPTVDSTLATLLMALDRSTLQGEGYMLCNEATAIRLLGSPNAPQSPLMKHIWLWLSLPVGTFPGANFAPCVLYFALAHNGTQPFHLTCPSTKAADIASTLTGITHQRRILRNGHQHFYEDTCERSIVSQWRACLAEYRTLHAEKPSSLGKWNIWMEHGTIRRHLTPFQEISKKIPKADAAALHALHGQSPFGLVMQKATRTALLRAVKGGIWRVSPEVLAATEQAMLGYHAERAPLYKLNAVQSLGWLDEEDSITCTADFTESKSNAHPVVDGRRRYFQSDTRLSQQNTPDSPWVCFEDKRLRGFKPKTESQWTVASVCFKTEDEAREWVYPSKTPLRTPPIFLAGKSYPISTATRIIERPSSRTNAVTGETENTTLHGQELVITIQGEYGAAHEFGDFTPEEKAKTESKGNVNCHSLESLITHFQIPEVPDVTTIHAARYQTALKWLDTFESNLAAGSAVLTTHTPGGNPKNPQDSLALSETQPETRNTGFKFRNYQREDMARAAVFGGCVMGWEPGLGKTVPLLLFGLLNDAKRHLIVAPEGLHKQIIKEAATKFGIHIKALNCQADFLADPDLQQWQRDHLARRESTVTGFWITSYSQLGYNGADEWAPREDDNGDIIISKKIIKERHSIPGWTPSLHDVGIGEERNGIRCICRPSLATLSRDAFDYVGCDEAVRLKSNESYTSLGVRRLRPAKARLVLTGTPVKNHLDDLFWLAQWAAGGHSEPSARFPYSGTNAAKEQFAKEFMFIEENHTRSEKKGRTMKKRIPVLCNLHRLWKFLGPLIIRRRKRDIGQDIVPKTIIPLTVRPGKAQLAVYQHHLHNPPDFSKEGTPLSPVARIGVQLCNLRVAALCPGSSILQNRTVNLRGVREVLKPTTPALTEKGVKVATLAARTPFEGERETALGLLEAMLQGEETPDVEALCAAAPNLADRIRAAVVIETRHPAARSWTDWNPKLAAILAKIAELIAVGEQVVVMSPFQDFGRDLHRRLTEAAVSCVLLDGDTSPAKRGTLADQFKSGKYAVLIGGQQSMGEGHSFECCSHLIAPSLSWALDVNLQCEDRVHRVNSPKPVTIYAMVTENTIDVRLEALYREKGDAAGLALDGEINHRDTAELDLASLLREAIANFDPTAPSIEEQQIETEWNTSLRSRLTAAMAGFSQWHPPITRAADGTRVTKAEVQSAIANLNTPGEAAQKPSTLNPQLSEHPLKAVPDATLTFLMGWPADTDTTALREDFQTYTNAHPSPSWRRSWNAFTAQYKPAALKPKPQPQSMLTILKNLGNYRG